MKLPNRMNPNYRIIFSIINTLEKTDFKVIDIFSALTEEQRTEGMDRANQVSSMVSQMRVHGWLDLVAYGVLRMSKHGKHVYKNLEKIPVAKSYTRTAKALAQPAPIKQKPPNVSIAASSVADSVGQVLNQNQFYRDLMLETLHKLANELDLKVVEKDNGSSSA